MLPLTPAVKFQLMWLALRVKHPKAALVSATLPLAIAQLEAKADFTSPLALNAHNIFGMKYPAGRAGVKLSTAVGQTASGFAVFKSIYSCIDDFMYWLEVQGIASDAALDDFIKSGKYSPDKGYYQTFTSIVAKLRPAMLNPANLALETALGGTALVVALSAIRKALK